MKTIKYINLPEKFKLEAYKKAANKFIDKYASHRDLLSIYQFGNVSVPGISDLDFIVVLKDRLTVLVSRHFSVLNFEEDLRYLLNHTQPFLMNRKIFENCSKIFPFQNLELVYGEAIPVASSGGYEKMIYDILSLVDVCIAWYPVLFLTQLYSSTLNVRYCLLILNALGFSLRNCQNVTGEKYQSWENFIEKVTSLRKKWFGLEEFNRNQRIFELLKTATDISLDLIRKVNDYIHEKLWVPAKDGNSSRVKEVGRYNEGQNIFLTGFDPPKMLKAILEFFKKTGHFISLLPASFYFPIKQYSLQKGMVSQHIKHRLSGRPNGFIYKNPEIKDIMRSRIDLMNSHASFYKDNEIQIDMVHKYYGYNPALPELRRNGWSFKELVNGIRGKGYQIKNSCNLSSAFLNSGLATGRCGRLALFLKLLGK